MNKNSSIVIAIICMIFSSCIDDNDYVQLKQPGDIAPGVICLSTLENNLLTREASSEYEEGKLYNAYIMLLRIDGITGGTPTPAQLSSAKILQRWSVSGTNLGYDNISSYQYQTNITKEAVESWSDGLYFFAGVSNYGEYNSIMNLSEDMLNTYKTYSDLENQRVFMKQGNFSYERGNNFLMSGRSDGFLNKEQFLEYMIDPSASVENQKEITVNLKRTDSKVRFSLDVSKLEDSFNASPGTSNVTVEMVRWRVHNLPTSTVLVESAAQNTYHNPDSLYTSYWANFEGVGEQLEETFSFYVLPQAFLKSDAHESADGQYVSISGLTDTPEELGVEIVGSDTIDIFTQDQKKDPNNLLSHFSFRMRKSAVAELLDDTN